MEALQFLKCFINHDLIFRAHSSASLDDLDKEEEGLTESNTQLVPDAEKSPSWDQMWLEEDDDAVMEG